ncbi:hypothetical protein GCM10009651_06220 [Microbacterium natoriense]|uniref:DUF4190 domain-containing protein n=1 Tax=Microbacterium natoriense TaxID=284570 RepID=UPI0031CF9DCB
MTTPAAPVPPAAPLNPAVPAPRPTNGLAIATLILGICGFAILPVILGHIALRQIRERGDAGTGLAITGLVLGYLAVAGWIIVGIIAAVAIAGGIASGVR